MVLKAPLVLLLGVTQLKIRTADFHIQGSNPRLSDGQISSAALWLVGLRRTVEHATGGKMDYRYGSHTVYKSE
jgi:hypothetical protein